MEKERISKNDHHWFQSDNGRWQSDNGALTIWQRSVDDLTTKRWQSDNGACSKWPRMCSFHAHLLLKSLPKSRCQNDNSVLILTPNVVDTLSYTDVVISYTDVVIFSLGVFVTFITAAKSGTFLVVGPFQPLNILRASLKTINLALLSLILPMWKCSSGSDDNCNL